MQHSASSFLVHTLLCGPSVHIRSFSELVKNNHVQPPELGALPATYIIIPRRERQRREEERRRESDDIVSTIL